MVKKFKIAAMINTLLYAIFFYLTWNRITDSKLVILFILTVVSFILTVKGMRKKIGATFNAIGIFPFVISSIIFFLFITGLWVYIALLFGIVPFAPN